MVVSDIAFRRKRKLKAEQYREFFLLPRYVVEEDGSKRKLESGEFSGQSRLYPLCVPISDLSDFGIGIGMYFTTLRWLGLLLMLCGIIQVPTADYFQSAQYDSNNWYDSGFKTVGSASCVDETFASHSSCAPRSARTSS